MYKESGNCELAEISIFMRAYCHSLEKSNLLTKLFIRSGIEIGHCFPRPKFTIKQLSIFVSLFYAFGKSVCIALCTLGPHPKLSHVIIHCHVFSLLYCFYAVIISVFLLVPMRQLCPKRWYVSLKTNYGIKCIALWYTFHLRYYYAFRNALCMIRGVF